MIQPRRDCSPTTDSIAQRSASTEPCQIPTAPNGAAGRRVLMVHPAIPKGTYWSYSEALHFVGKKALMPPLGLLTVAGMLPADCEVRLIDECVEPLTDADLAWAEVVFVSGMIVQDAGIREVIRRVRAAGKPLVAGGPHPTTSYASLEGIDHLIHGEAEGIFQRFWADFVAGRAKRVYARPAMPHYIEDLSKHYAPEEMDVELVETRPAMSQAPTPRFDLLKLDAYKSMAVQSSRGCPIGCEFCDIWRRFGKLPRCRTVDAMLLELQALHDLGWKDQVFIVDDNFIGNKKRAKEMLAAIGAWQKERGYPFSFLTEATLTLADDPELLELCRQAVLDMVFVGIETPAEESLHETRKGINTSRSIAERVATIQSYAIEVTSGFIIGFDNDPDDIDARMVDCIEHLGIPAAMVGLLQALPETDLHDRLEAEGRLRYISAGDNTHNFDINFETKRPRAEVIEGYKQVLRTIYSPDLKSFFKRCTVLRRNWGKPVASLPTDRGRFWAFVKYAAGLPFHRYGWNAFKFLASTAFRRPDLFTHAVSLGIQGHHFRAITRRAFEEAEIQGYFTESLSAFREEVRRRAESIGGSVQGQAHDAWAAMAAYKEGTLKEARRRWRRLSRNTRQHLADRYEAFHDELDEILRAHAPSPRAS